MIRIMEKYLVKTLMDEKIKVDFIIKQALFYLPKWGLLRVSANKVKSQEHFTYLNLSLSHSKSYYVVKV